MLLPAGIVHPVARVELCLGRAVELFPKIFLHLGNTESLHDGFVCVTREEGLVGDDGPGVLHNGLLEFSNLCT